MPKPKDVFTAEYTESAKMLKSENETESKSRREYRDTRGSAPSIDPPIIRCVGLHIPLKLWAV